MKKYDSYKNSEIEWLGVIPEHWEVTKLKFIGNAIGGLTYAPNDVVEDETKGKLVLRSSNIQDGKLSLNDNVYVNLEISEKLTLKKGDILICSRNGSQHLIGKNICIDERTEGNTFGAFMMIFRSEYYAFLNHFFNSPIFTSQSGLFLTATINQLTSGTLNNFYIALPKSLEEQIAIANYLDHKATQIDNLIAKKEQFITLLQEERTAIINQAVTKGLDPNVPMKDSGIEWIGKIPEHWNIKRLKFLGNAIGGLTYSPNDVVENSNEGVLVLRSSNIQNGKLSLKDNVYVNLEISEKITLKKGDILICSRNGSKNLIGKNICIDEQMEGNTFGAFMMIFRSKHWQFLNHFFNSSIFTSQSGLFLTATINQLTSNTLNNFFIAIPESLDEQISIARLIDSKINEVDKIISKAQQEIKLLKEYKTALISEVVTGKVDVRK